MEESVNYAEYTVDKKPEGKLKWIRIGLISLYLFVGVGLFAFFLAIKFWPAGTVMPFLTWILYGLTWKFAQLEHKYEVKSAKLVISNIYGRKKQVVQFENLASELKVIAPMNEGNRKQFEKADKIMDFRGNTASPDAYYAILEKDGKSTAVYFEATNKMLKVLKFYNRNTEVTPVRY
ncbi:MAG: hypothetical protein E7628_06870 [Ruminococcaceae bacterium]|nr:hypothetical protein [Oscillospiraceae bacterium]